MSLDAEVVNEIHRIAAAVQALGKSTDDAQSKTRRMGDEVARSAKQMTTEVEKSRREWERKRRTLLQVVDAQDRQSGSARNQLSVTGGLSNAVQGLAGQMRQLSPALLIPAIVTAAWEKLKQDIQEVTQSLTAIEARAQDIATGGGFAAGGASLADQARVIASSGGFSAETLVKGAGAFKGTAKSADLHTTIRAMRQMQTAAAAGVADPTTIARAAGSLVEGGMDVESAFNLAGYIAESAGEDSAAVINALRAGIGKFGAQHATELTGHLLAAGDPRRLRQVVARIGATGEDEGFGMFDLRNRVAEGQGYQARLGPATEAAEQARTGYLNRTADAVAANNPDFVLGLIARQQANLAEQIRHDRLRTHARRRQFFDAQMKRAEAEGGVTGAAAITYNTMTRIPLAGSLVEWVADQALSKGATPGAQAGREAEIEALQRVAEAAERTANRAGQGGGL